jgi:hypothetical protein
VIGDVHHQLETWQDASEADIDEDALADLHNDIAYLEIILHRLEHTHGERYGVAV